MSKADKLLKRIEFYDKMASSQKPETDALLKKAALFERLALYSDRKSFLHAIAQLTDPSASTDPSLKFKSQIDGLFRQAFAIIGKADGEPQPLAWAWQKTPPDLGGLIRAIDAAALKMSQLTYSQESEQLRKIVGQLRAYQQTGDTGLPQETSPGSAGASGTTPKGHQGFPPINREDQQAVFNFAIQQGELVPDPAKQMADGDLGPETRKALEGIKNYFAKKNPQNPRMTDQQAITAAKFKGR